MSRPAPRKRKKSPARRKKGGSRGKFPYRIFSFLLIFVLLLFSVGAAGYVIFFRTSVAHGGEIVFEEPYPAVPEQPEEHVKIHDSTLPRVAIIIDDMGYHRKTGNALLDLPMNLTFSFLPAAPFTMELEEKAFQLGRTIFLHLPLEPKNSEWDPGPGAIFTRQSQAEQETLFYRNLSGVPHAVGVNNHMGSLYTENRQAMDRLMKLLGREKLIFVDSFTTAASSGMEAARAAGVPAAKRHIFLDNVHSQDKVCVQLQNLVKVAQKQGWAIGIGHPNEATLAALTNCQTRLLEKVQLVSAQELLQGL